MSFSSPLRRMFGVPASATGPVTVGASGGGLPTGKGVFVRSLERHVGTPEQFIEKAKWAGLRWVPILTLWQYDESPPPTANAQPAGGGGNVPPFFQKPFNQELAPYVAALAQAGIQPWLWGSPVARPDAVDSFVQVVGTLAKQTGAAGVIVDVENTWSSVQGVETMAANLVGGVRQQSGGRPVGVMSYGWAPDHPTFPWGVFAQSADFGAPQVYDAQGERPEDYQGAAVNAYAQSGFRSVIPILPTWGAHGEDGTKMKATLQKTPAPASAVLWWDWHNLNENLSRWEAIRSAQVGADAVHDPRP